ncbi:MULTISPECIES: DeoR/GlpR family DNA-binding transcription regulator [unclassified Sporolactobacillus]|uniref:DeoR/GlpR family DNA-binding transcription regulator n=1 Tax=unclassified Sporolactobacillus TaxID=2628533 RepID=UPI00236890C0|nr:DeoR/GlpR family DNA-binding transcription regulator [Sporolactobacillus sp. CQH2019]MDD9149056.1 DeoR/GlpR family DNA-binding transcription regulator [Sporolactobacillus sp. CQH2019]
MAKPLNIERRTKVAQLIMLRGSISVRELARQFDVSTETIRKDLILLEKENIISKEHGGATISSHYSESHFSDKLLKNSAVKTRLAQKALEMVPERGVVILDTGTTVLQIAKLLNLKNDLVIITNSLIAAEALENTENQLLLTGGQLRRKSMSFVGDWATRAVASIRADITFVGCDGFHEDGPCSRSYRELDVKQTIIENSEKVVLVADSSKFSRDGLYRFATFDQIDYLLTDSGITGQQRELFSSHVELIVV